jgi:ribosomal protein L20
LGMSYCRFMDAINKLEIHLDRRALSELAIRDSPAFEMIVNRAKASLVR